MIRLAFIILLMTVFFYCNAQTNPSSLYEDVVKLDSNIYSKENLYANAKLYFVDVYKSAKDVIQYDEKSEGRVIGKGFLNLSTIQKYNIIAHGTISWDVHYTIEVVCKNGRYRYRIYDIYVDQLETAENGDTKGVETSNLANLPNLRKRSWFKKGADELYSKIGDQFKSTIFTLKKYMSKTIDDKKDNF